MTKITTAIQKHLSRSSRLPQADLDNLKKIFEKFEAQYAAFRTPELMPDLVAEAIESVVRSSTRDKDVLINQFRGFLVTLKQEYGTDMVVKFPPIPVSNTFERLMFIAKFIQNPDHTIDELTDILWTNRRSIDKDISRLEGLTSDPIQINGKRFIIRNMQRKRGKFLLESTVHPLFLMGNLTQIIVMLRGLKKMSLEPACREYAQRMAASIWQQLTEYARKRVLFVTKELMPDDLEWYRKLDSEVVNFTFYSERDCSGEEGVTIVLDCIKNGKTCQIEYALENGNTRLFTDCRITKYLGDQIEIMSDSGQEILDLDNIVRSSYYKETLY